LILNTVTPIKTPFSHIYNTCEKTSFLTYFNNYFILSELQWEYGYGDLTLDNIPSTLQPKLTLEFNSLIVSFITSFLQNNAVTFKEGKVHFFNHNIAVILLDFEIDEENFISTIDSEFDHKLSGLLENIYTLTLEKPLNLLQKTPYTCLNIDMDEQKKNHINFMINKPVLWTARYLILPDKYKSNHNLLSWASIDEINCEGIKNFNFFISSGNGLIFTSDIYYFLNDFKKTIILPQFYYAFLNNYNDYFETALKRFNSLNKKMFSPKRSVDKLLNKTQEKIENQEYLALSISDAIRGTQGVRSILLQHIFKNWNLKELEEDSAKKTSFLYKKLDTWMKKIIQMQNRTVEVVLSLMGGIALVDFILNLLVSAPVLKNRTIESYSIIQFFNKTTADMAIYTSSSLLFLALIYIYFKRK